MKKLTDGDILKKIRKLRRLTQQECCQGIVSRHTYSRIEQNQTSLQVHIFLEILERLNVTYDDFLFFKNIPLEENLWTTPSRKKLNEHSFNESYAYFKKNKRNSIKHFYYYLLHQKELNNLAPNSKDKPTIEDIACLNSYISSLTFFSTIDLALFSDLCDYLKYDNAKNASLKIIKQINELYIHSDISTNTQQYIHHSLFTITYIALKNKDYTFVKYLLKQSKFFLLVFPNTYFLVTLQLNTQSLNYKLTGNSYYLLKLFTLKDCIKEINDFSFIEQVEQRIKQLIQEATLSE